MKISSGGRHGQACVSTTHAAVFPRSDLRSRSPFALRVVSSSARGDVPFRALWGKSTPRSGDVSPSGFCKGLPLAYAFADFSRIRKVSAGVGRNAKAESWRTPQRGVWETSPQIEVRRISPHIPWWEGTAPNRRES